MEQWLIHLVASSPHSVYGVIILVSAVEGPILALVCGLLIRLGIMPLIWAYFALMLGDLLGDVFWYSLGRYFGLKFIQRFGGYVGITMGGVEVVEKIFHKYHDRILIISKITMGFGFALVTLVTAGIVKIPFGRYMTLNILGQFVWTAILLSIGYFLGNFYLMFNNILGQISVVAGIIIIIVCLLHYGRFIKKRILKKIA